MNPVRLFKEYLTRRWMKRRGLVGGNSRKVEPGFQEKFLDLFENSRWVGVFVFFLLLICGVVSIDTKEHGPRVPKFVDGQESSTTVFSEFEFSYRDAYATEQKIRDAVRKLPVLLEQAPGADSECVRKLRLLLGETRKRMHAETAGEKYTPSPTAEGKMLEESSARQYEILAKIQRAPAMQRMLFDMLREAVSGGLVEDVMKESNPNRDARIVDSKKRMLFGKPLKDYSTPEQAAVRIADQVLQSEEKDGSALREALARTLAEILNGGVLRIDRKSMDDVAQKVRLSMPPSITSVRKGDLLIRRGGTVRENDRKLLEIYREKIRERESGKDRFSKTLVTVRSLLICMVLMLFSGIYLYHLHPEILKSNTALFQTGVVMAVGIVLNILASGIFLSGSGQETIPPWLSFLALPLGFAPAVLSPMYGMRSALFAGLFVSGIAALSGTDPFNVLFSGLLVSGIGAFFVRGSLNYRSYFMTGAVTLSCTAAFLGLLLMWYDMGTLEASFFPWILILPLATGFVTAMLAQFALYVEELLGGTSTNMSLLLYSDYNHPLLKKLQFEAPGTYHHSLVVSTLAEAAAKEIGANPILARVQALFHDVGKLSQPDYFTENSGGENKHRDLPPKLSALIILNHVKKGLALARKYKLRKPLRDAIARHHGTDLVYFFYKKAKDSGELIDEHDFRYDGPEPQTKEIAILSLADACEAASRSLEKPTHGKIEEMVTEIFNKRLRDGQLDNANLTFRELATVRNCFVRMLTSMMHARISYPKDEKQDENDLFMDAAAKKASENKTA